MNTSIQRNCTSIYKDAQKYVSDKHNMKLEQVLCTHFNTLSGKPDFESLTTIIILK
jgi:hypothetical protein